MRTRNIARAVRVPADGVGLDGDLVVPDGARGVVLFAHGSGSTRHSPRNRYVASMLEDVALGTLLIDLLTTDEARRDDITAELRFDMPLLARRLVGVVDWLAREQPTLRVGCFGASTGAAAALIAAAQRPDEIAAVVSRGGRPDLAVRALPAVMAPTLLIVGGRDVAVIGVNQRALADLRCEKRLEIVPGATHLFEEAGALERVADLTRRWFVSTLDPQPIGLPHGEPMVPMP